MALILYSSEGIEGLLTDLGQQLGAQAAEQKLLSSVEVSSDENETLTLEIRTYPDRIVSEYLTEKEAVINKTKIKERLIVPGQHG